MKFRFPSPLYVIIDPAAGGRLGPVDLAEAVLAAGVRILQLRVKDRPTGEIIELARAFTALAELHQALFIVNDRADVAKLVGAAGVHLGQEDLPPSDARAWLGEEAIIGVSTHSVEQAEAAAGEGIADYLGFGPVFATTTKRNPDPVQGLGELRKACARVDRPIVAIGGISSDNIDAVSRAGASAAAVVSDIACAADPSERVALLLRQYAFSR